MKILNHQLEYNHEELVGRDNYPYLIRNYLIYKGIDKPVKRNVDDIMTITLRTALYAIEYKMIDKKFRGSNDNSKKNCFYKLLKKEKSSENMKPIFVTRWNQVELDFKTYVYELIDYESILKKITYFLDNYEDIDCLIVFDIKEKERREYLYKITDLLKNNANEIIQMYNSLGVAYKAFDDLLESFDTNKDFEETLKKYKLSEEIKKANYDLQVLGQLDWVLGFMKRNIGNSFFIEEDWKYINDDNIQFLP